MNPFRISALNLAADLKGGTEQLAAFLDVGSETLLHWIDGTKPVPMLTFLKAVDVSLDSQEGRERNVLLINRLPSGFWRVTLSDGGLVLDLYTRNVAGRFARQWAREHAPCEVRFFGADGELERRVRY